VIGQERTPQAERVKYPRIARSPVTHDCPACDGIVAGENVTIGDFKLVEPANGPAFLQRRLTFHCPHCEHYEQREEQRPL